MKAQFELDYYKNISPKYNKQVDRMKTVTRQIENPGALARGVRSMIAANIIDKPLELMTTFIVSAGITSGIMMPIQPEMFSADSWFYLSRYVFLNGMVFSTITSVLSHVWMKVQMDTLNEGNFDQIPEGNEKKLSFMQWFYKKGIKDSNNSWWANQKHYNKIITANLKAAFVMTTTFNLLSMHRFDLDSYLTGYIFAYCFLSNGLYAKIEQAFDLSTGWFAKDIPKDILNTPEIRTHLNNTITKSRLMFNFVYRNFENITGYFFGNLINMGTPKLGGRSFARIIFGGNTPTNLLSNVFEKTGEKIPFIKPLTSACNAFFSNGYKEK